MQLVRFDKGYGWRLCAPYSTQSDTAGLDGKELPRLLLVPGLGGDERGVSMLAETCSITHDIYCITLDENHPPHTGHESRFPQTIDQEAVRMLTLLDTAVQPTDAEPLFSVALGTSLGAAVLLKAWAHRRKVAHRIVLDSAPLFTHAPFAERVMRTALLYYHHQACVAPDKLRSEACDAVELEMAEMAISCARYIQADTIERVVHELTHFKFPHLLAVDQSYLTITMGQKDTAYKSIHDMQRIYPHARFIQIQRMRHCEAVNNAHHVLVDLLTAGVQEVDMKMRQA